MLKKTLIATATAGMIATGALATTTSASAAPPGPAYGGIQFGGPGWSVGIGFPGYPAPPRFRPHRVCEPVFKRVIQWQHGHRQWRVIKVGERCRWVYPPVHPVAVPYPGPGPHPAPGPHPGPHPGGPGPYPHP